MSNIKRERFNLSFSVSLLKSLRQIAHERTMSSKVTGVNELVEEAVNAWLSSYTIELDPETYRSIEFVSSARTRQITELITEAWRAYDRLSIAAHRAAAPLDEILDAVDRLAERRQKEQSELFRAHLAGDSVPESEHARIPKDTSGMPDGMLTSVASSPLASTTSIPQEFEPWVARLLFILKANFPKAVCAIQTNLIAFEALTELGVPSVPPPGSPDPDEGKSRAEIIDDVERASQRVGDLAEDSGSGHPKRRKAS